MQDQYTADIGDFVKMCLLRVVARQARLGVIWYRVETAFREGDGRHVAYLRQPTRWHSLDPGLFDGLRQIVDGQRRRIDELHAFLPSSTIFFGEAVPLPADWREREAQRAAWFARARVAMAGAELVFLDPDNGLAGPALRLTRARAVKSVTPGEVEDLIATGKSVLLYHHQSRLAGGHQAEIVDLARRLRARGCVCVDVIRAGAFSPRLFLLLNGTPAMRTALSAFAAQWRHHDVTMQADVACAAHPAPLAGRLAAKPLSSGW